MNQEYTIGYRDGFAAGSAGPTTGFQPRNPEYDQGYRDGFKAGNANG